MIFLTSLFKARNFFFIFALTLYGAGGDYPKITWLVIISSFFYLFFLFAFNESKKIDIKDLYIFFITGSWLFFPTIFSFFYYDSILNFKLILETLLYLLFSIFFINILMKNDEVLKEFFITISFFWVLTSCICFLLYLLNIISYETTFSSVYTNRNLYSIVCILFLIPLLCFFERNIKRDLLCLSLIAFVLATASIKGFLGVALVLYLYRVKEINIIKILGLILLLSVSILIVIQTDSLISTRMSSLISTVSNSDLSGMGSASERLWLLVNGTSLAFDNWLTGIGLYNSKYYLFPPWQILKAERVGEAVVGLYTHNNYLEMFLSAGVFGFLFYYLPFFMLFLKSISIFFKSNYLRFSLITLSYKLFLDFGMVSYNSLPIIFFYVLSVYFIVHKRFH